jgi:rSAM/selenodomain-associated transferase 2
VQIVVLIPALAEAESIPRTVESAREPGVDVVVVDGGSRDGTRERARAAGARVLGAAPGRARQLEAGRRAVEGDVLLFLHADTRLPSGFATAVREALADPDVVGGAFRLRFDRRTPALRLIEWGARVRGRLLALPYGDQGLFVRRTVLEALGGVPQVTIMEDLDLVHGMKQRGRLARLRLPVTTSARRYLERGVVRTFLRNVLAASAWALGIERSRVAAWYRR